MSKKPLKKAFLRYLQIKFFPPLVKGIMRIVLWTCRVKLVGMERYYETVDKYPSIIMLWHNRIFLGPNFFGEYTKTTNNYTAYVSGSRDGEWLSLATESYKNGFTIRVPKKNKHESLRIFIKTLKKSVVLVTPDGPLGPRYKIKPGVVVAAQLSKAQIFPFSWSASRCWRLSTWDKLMIPKPFSKIYIGFGDPFFISSKKDQSLSEKIKQAEDNLSNFKEELEQRLKLSKTKN